jgi:hypothetical protein
LSNRVSKTEKNFLNFFLKGEGKEGVINLVVSFSPVPRQQNQEGEGETGGAIIG